MPSINITNMKCPELHNVLIAMAKQVNMSAIDLLDKDCGICGASIIGNYKERNN